VDFAAVLERLAAFFESRNHRFALIGGVGLAAYGIARATVDLDLVVDASAQEEAIEFLESLGYETLYRSTGYSNHQHPARELGRVDLVYVRGETSRRLFDAARMVQGPGNVRIRVPIPEHLIAMKIVAMKNDPSRTYQDMADIKSLLSIPGVDREEVRSQFEKHGLLERYLELEAS
jgi:D-arabinose 1-dehydrogenase-like Zn-dependent alcohol dehydrogenase